MQFEISRDLLLKPLQFIAGVVERRQTLPILSNVLLSLKENELSLTGTDLEVELIMRIKLDKFYAPAEITVPARKLMDICRSFADQALLSFRLETEKLILTSGRSRFSLATLPAQDFPKVAGELKGLKLKSTAESLRSLFDQTSFAMAQDDVRYFLNGTLINASKQTLTAVATDGHRLALSTQLLASELDEHINIIVPRKGVNEIQHLLADRDKAEITLSFNTHHVRIAAEDFTLTSKLVDGRYPEYQKVIPKEGGQLLSVDRDVLKTALTRVSILSAEKVRGVRLELTRGQMRLLSNNPEQEQAEDEIEVDYNGDPLEISFNIQYLLDVLSVLNADFIQMHLTNSTGSVLIDQPKTHPNCLYVIMPMRL
jgi:DNA polymerase-3 subunit beta